MKIGEKIKALRIEKQMTQNQLATISEISESAIRKYEKGERQPRLNQLTKIASTLGVNVNDLLSNSTDLTKFNTWINIKDIEKVREMLPKENILEVKKEILKVMLNFKNPDNANAVLSVIPDSKIESLLDTLLETIDIELMVDDIETEPILHINILTEVRKNTTTD